VAAHYASWDYIAAYEVMAEPRDKAAAPAIVTEFYRGACNAVQVVDSHTPCMVGPGPYYKLWKFTPDILLLDNPNVIYTFDYFSPEAFVFGEPSIPTYPGTYNCTTLFTDVWVPECCPDGAGAKVSFDAGWSAANFAKWAIPIKQRGVPVFVNQWTTVHGVPASAGRYRCVGIPFARFPGNRPKGCAETLRLPTLPNRDIVIAPWKRRGFAAMRHRPPGRWNRRNGPNSDRFGGTHFELTSLQVHGGCCAGAPSC
jgi:hypothetical protein